MANQLLRDKDVIPHEENLKESLGKRYAIYKELIHSLASDPYGLSIDWRYYNDGKAWLCKVCHKKKTVLWLSVWDKYFQISFYFTEKNVGGVLKLNIDETIKNDLSHFKSVGRLIPLVIKVNRKKQLEDVLSIVDYKRNLK